MEIQRADEFAVTVHEIHQRRVVHRIAAITRGLLGVINAVELRHFRDLISGTRERQDAAIEASEIFLQHFRRIARRVHRHKHRPQIARLVAERVEGEGLKFFDIGAASSANSTSQYSSSLDS